MTALPQTFFDVEKCRDLAPSIEELRLGLERLYMSCYPLSTSPRQRHWGERNTQCSSRLHYTPLPTHRIRIEIRTLLRLRVIICVLGGLQSHLRLEARFPVLDTVCCSPLSPSLSVVYASEIPANFVQSSAQLSTQLLSLDTAHLFKA